MKEVRFINWKFEVDYELNKKEYCSLVNTSSEHINNIGFDNYNIQINSIYPDIVKVFFDEIGVDIDKFYIVSYPSYNGELQRIFGNFVFNGRMLLGDMTIVEAWMDDSFYKINDMFSIVFSYIEEEKVHNNGIPIVEVGFEIMIPWLLPPIERPIIIPNNGTKDNNNLPF